MAEEVKEGADQEEKEAKKGGKKKLIIFVLVGLLILGIAGGVVLFLGGKKDKEEAKKEKVKKEIEKTFFVTFDPIIVNLMDPTGKRYLQIQISLEVGKKELEDELKEKEPIIRDVIISVLGEKTVNDVLAPEAKEEIKKELLEKINQALGENIVLKVYILQYIVE